MRNLDALPDIAGMRRLMRSLAILDAILCPDWESRYYSFNSTWGPGEMMASMRTGEGDHWFLWLGSAGAALCGLAHESPMFEMGKPWPGIYESLPAAFAGFKAEPAFDTANTTFCIWRQHDDDRWHRGNIDFPEHHDPDGSKELLALLDGKPASYRTWASEYYEREVPLAPVEAIYRHEPLSDELVRALNADLSLADCSEDIAEIGYPES